MLRRLYNLVFPVALLLMLPGYLRRMVRRGNYRRHFGQRFGYYSSETKRRLDGMVRPVWVQAVSVGEMLVALKLIAALRVESPDLALVLSTTTTTGYALALEQAPPEGLLVVYTPVDLLGSIRRAFDAIRPAQLIIVDGGLWPNQLWEARRRNVPTALVNARLSPRSERRFRIFPRLSADLFGLLDLVCVPEDADLDRWRSLGVKSAGLLHTGSVKFDDAVSPPPMAADRLIPSDNEEEKRALLASLAIPADAPVLLAGSTHPDEEKAIAEAFLTLRVDFPGLFLIVAPRHVERSAQVQSALEALGLRVTLRTNLLQSPVAASPDVLLINTTGELRDWYRTATLVFIGKSLHAVGGQNPAEAIVAGVPVIFGPHMENFAELTYRLLAANAAVQIADIKEMVRRCSELLADPAERARMAETARQQILAHRGAAARTAAAVLAQNRNSACQVS